MPPVVESNFVDPVVAAFATQTGKQWSQAKDVILGIQANARMTEAKLGDVPEGQSTLWSSVKGLEGRVSDQGMILASLSVDDLRLQTNAS